ncbi:MAG TPA: dihydrofolate reductase family protein [Thermoanaerobaculia bacterium]|nr:dihydrofolate reductase family protein [Thermoanaerobaculia bacterium]
MRKLMMKMSLSLDGFVATANGKNDWIFKSSDEASRAWVVSLLQSAGVHIMGRKTFQDMASYWPTSRVFDGDLAEGIRQLKSEPGNPILAHGGAEFMRSLIATGLIDEYHLVTHPVALGEGMPIFNGIAQALDLKLVDVKAFPAGAVVHTYHA